MVKKDSGPIGQLTLPSLIHDLCGASRTGTLALKDDRVTKTLYLDQGRVVFAASTDPRDRLGQLFLRRGMISLRSLKQAAGIAAAEEKRLGAALVQMKAIRPQDLVWGVAEQVKEMVVSLFQWTRGDYVFTPGSLPSEEVITLKMPTADLVMSGIKRIEDWPRIEAAVGDLETCYRASPKLEELAREMNLSLDEWTLLARCESGATLGQMCDESPLSDFDVCRLIWAFLVVGLLDQATAARTAAIS